MTGFSGRISTEGDADVAASLMGAAIKHADRLHAWKQTQRVDNVTRAYDLEGGNYCFVVDLKNIRALHIVAPRDSEPRYPSYEDTELPVAAVGVIDVVSGRVISPTIVKHKLEYKGADGKKKTTEIDVLRSFRATSKTQSRYTDLIRRRRLAVRENGIFATIKSTSSAVLNDIVYSEHAHVRPTHYSGAMRQAVQVLLGIGNILRPTYEEAWMKKNKKSPLLSNTVRSAFTLYRKANPNGFVQLAWDYRFAKTHGVTFDSKNKPWLVEVSTRGVHAMPLYMDPVSQTVAGKQRYKAVSPELTEFLDKFGGIPIGVTMPVRETFTKYKNAGEVVQLASTEQMQRFYSKYSFSTELGWCFNDNGTEAHNTCYGYGAHGVAEGYHFALKIQINGETIPKFTTKTRKAATLFAGTENYKVNKCRRMSDSEAQTLIDQYDRDPEKARKAFDDLVVKPTLTGSATLVEVDKGKLFHPNKFKGQPQIKFPEPIIGGLVSFDFTPAGGFNSVPERLRPKTCDAPMFVAYTDKGLQTVRYFYDPRKQGEGGSFSTRETCQFTGTWESGSIDDSYMYGNFYSTEIDWREELSHNWSLTKSTGRLIYTHNAAAAEFFFAMCIQVRRIYTYWIKSSMVRIRGGWNAVSVAIPEGDRCAYYMMQSRGADGIYETESGGATGISGPYVHYYQIRQFVWHWFGRCYIPPSDVPVQGGWQCVAKKMAETIEDSCVEVGNASPPDEMVYRVCPVDGGNGLQKEPITVMSSWNPPAIIGSASWPTRRPPTAYTTSSREDDPEATCEVRLHNKSGHGEVVVKKEKKTGFDPDGYRVTLWSLNISGWWFKAAPDEESGACPQLSVTHSCLGSNVMNYLDDLDGNTKSIGGPDNMRAGSKTCYTGVIE